MMTSAFDPELATMVAGVLLEPPDGSVYKSLVQVGLNDPMHILFVDDLIVDLLSYDDNGMTKDLDLMKKTQIRNLRDFLSQGFRKIQTDDRHTFANAAAEYRQVFNDAVAASPS